MAERFALQGKVGLVTGAASGLGAALALRLAEAGCAALALVDKDEAGLSVTAAAVAATGCALSTHVVELTDRGAVDALPTAVLDRHGRLDLLVNNAGVAVGGTFAEIAPADFDWLMAINFEAVVRLTRACLPALRQGQAARIVNISSLFGIVAPPGQTAYCASKFAVRGFTEALRHECIGTPLGVTLVHPGGIATAIARNARSPAGTDADTIERGRVAMERHLTLSPAAAAATVVAGIERGAWRIIVGRDAKALVWLQRLMPVRYWTAIVRLSRP